MDLFLSVNPKRFTAWFDSTLGTMNDFQFILLLKKFFFEYFILKGDQSIMNLSELLESYKKQIIEDYNNKKSEDNGHSNIKK